MKRKFFYLAAGALVLTGCASEDVVEDVKQDKNVISFENVVNKHSRAEDLDLSYAKLKQFNVYGFYTTPDNDRIAVEVFKNVPVKRQADATWSYTFEGGSEKQYWIPRAKYYFFAYSCGADAELNGGEGYFEMDMQDDISASNRVLKLYNYVCDATHQHDLIYADATGESWGGIEGKTTGNEPVSFQFKHLLTKVQAQFTSKFTPDYTLEVSDVSFENIRNIGNYTPGADGWQDQGRTESGEPHVFLLNTDDPAVMPVSTVNGQDPAVTNCAYVIPCAYSGQDATEETESTWVYLKFTLTLYNKNQKVAVKELTGKFNPNWKTGYSYLYNIQVSGDDANFNAISFTTATDANGNVITNWETDGDVIVIDKN